MGIELIIQIILLLVGFVFLIKGADIFVEGSSTVAAYLKIPTLIVGLTIVAFGTSLPEAAVSIASSATGANAIAVSNVIGSNLFNILLIIGLCATLHELDLEEIVVKRDIPLLTAMTFLLAIFILIGWNINQIEGIILFCLIICYVAYLVYNVKKQGEATEVEEPKISIIRSIVYIMLGLIGIVLGGEFVVDSATYIALTCGMSQTLVGLTIVAIGTSLPEVVTSLTALKKGETGIIIGNVIGSNLFNILFVLGASSAISTITLNPSIILELVILVVATVICLILAYTDTKFDKKEGLVLLTLFIMYMLFIIIRN